jgi:hypothetical protein
VSAGKTLVLIVGPPAVGKMTVGAELSRITGIPLFHNHLSIEAVLPVFPFGSGPFDRLVSEFRQHMFSEVVQSQLPGLIFTYVWAFDSLGDLQFVEGVKSLFETHGARTVFVELWADVETRLARNETHNRLLAKASKRDVARSRERLLSNEANHRLSSDGDFPFGNHLWLDNTTLSPEAAARQIARHFSLPTVTERDRTS